ncbi:MAG TPA: hypothetical protein VMB75_07215, partial [Rhodocyclaceae bacterium]|nr:hypothetical protein [Rhodocyclaceae bacterium]
MPTSHRPSPLRVPLLLGFCLTVAVLLPGCATNSMTGRSQLSIVSEKAAIAQAASAYDSMVVDLKNKN